MLEQECVCASFNISILLCFHSPTFAHVSMHNKSENLGGGWVGKSGRCGDKYEKQRFWDSLVGRPGPIMMERKMDLEWERQQDAQAEWSKSQPPQYRTVPPTPQLSPHISTLSNAYFFWLATHFCG